MRRLLVLCAQDYCGTDMTVSPCTRCSANWDRSTASCTVSMGCEHLPMVATSRVPACPMEHECQHQIQSLPGPCPVRARGMVCESALTRAGVDDAGDLDYSFHAMMMGGDA